MALYIFCWFVLRLLAKLQNTSRSKGSLYDLGFLTLLRGARIDGQHVCQVVHTCANTNSGVRHHRFCKHHQSTDPTPGFWPWRVYGVLWHLGLPLRCKHVPQMMCFTTFWRFRALQGTPQHQHFFGGFVNTTKTQISLQCFGIRVFLRRFTTSRAAPCVVNMDRTCIAPHFDGFACCIAGLNTNVFSWTRKCCEVQALAPPVRRVKSYVNWNRNSQLTRYSCSLRKSGYCVDKNTRTISDVICGIRVLFGICFNYLEWFAFGTAE